MQPSNHASSDQIDKHEAKVEASSAPIALSGAQFRIGEERRIFTFLQMEASLCAWEAMIELRSEIPALNAEWDDRGSIQMRHKAYKIGDIVLELWDMLNDDERDAVAPYDFEFVPAVVRQIDWDSLDTLQVFDGSLETAKRCILAGALLAP